MNFQRFGIYFTPSDKNLAAFGAHWLGWDLAHGTSVKPIQIDGLPLPWKTIVATPRKYGFHATIKPPFHLADGHSADDLAFSFERFCSTTSPVVLDRLELARLGRFLALVPVGDTGELSALAAKTVRELDEFRAPPTESELAKRRASGLSPEQDALLLRWGYPYVMDMFRFHVTLTSKLPKSYIDGVRNALLPEIAQHLTSPFQVDALSLVGEDPEGKFHLIHRRALSG